MRKIISATVFLLFSMCTFAVSVKDAWRNMPATLVPHLDASKRVSMLDQYESGLDEGVQNGLEGESRIEVVMADYMRVSVSRRSVFEMKLLDTVTAENTTDTVICISQTYMGECPESKLSLYTRDWQLISDTIFTSRALLVKPDTMSRNCFEELLTQIPLVLWRVSLASGRSEALLSPSLPFTAIEDKEKFAPILLQRSLKWDGKIFKEY